MKCLQCGAEVSPEQMTCARCGAFVERGNSGAQVWQQNTVVQKERVSDKKFQELGIFSKVANTISFGMLCWGEFLVKGYTAQMSALGEESSFGRIVLWIGVLFGIAGAGSACFRRKAEKGKTANTIIAGVLFGLICVVWNVGNMM